MLVKGTPVYVTHVAQDDFTVGLENKARSGEKKYTNPWRNKKGTRP